MVSLISFVGAATLAMSEKFLKKILLVLVGLAAGALIGGAFLHMLPKSLEGFTGNIDDLFIVLIMGFVLFFTLEKLLWRHCHEKTCTIHTFAYLNLVGDGVHNFIDGLIIAAGFIVGGVSLGLITTLAVAAHEIPQEIGDFGVIVYGGFKPKKALLLNFATALTAIGGGIFGFYLFPYIGGAQQFFLPFAAGGFLYIAASDLVPELHREPNTIRGAASFGSFLVGVFMMWGIKLMFVG